MKTIATSATEEGRAMEMDVMFYDIHDELENVYI